MNFKNPRPFFFLLLTLLLSGCYETKSAAPAGAGGPQ